MRVLKKDVTTYLPFLCGTQLFSKLPLGQVQETEIFKSNTYLAFAQENYLTLLKYICDFILEVT